MPLVWFVNAQQISLRLCMMSTEVSRSFDDLLRCVVTAICYRIGLTTQAKFTSPSQLDAVIHCSWAFDHPPDYCVSKQMAQLEYLTAQFHANHDALTAALAGRVTYSDASPE